MALVSRPVELPVPCPSPARVGSTGTIHYLLQKERPMDQQSFGTRGAGAGPKSSKEFVHVCREVVSVSCGQPLLSYKPKRTKSAKIVKAPDAKSGACSSKSNPDSNSRSVSSRVVANAIRLAGASEVAPATELRRGDSSSKPCSSPRVKALVQDLQAARKSTSHNDLFCFDLDAEKKMPTTAAAVEQIDDDVQKVEYPLFQQRSVSLLGQKPLPDDYHKALIPFLRAEWDASAKILKRRQSNQVAKRGVHRRSTSLGSTSSTPVPNPDQKAWQSYTRDSYPPFSASKKYSFFRLSSTENI